MEECRPPCPRQSSPARRMRPNRPGSEQACRRISACHKTCPRPASEHRETAPMTAQPPPIKDPRRIVRDLRVPIVPALIAAGGERASLRFLEFFAAAIRNPHTRRAYAGAVAASLAWCEGAGGIRSLTAVQPLHVATWIELQSQTHSAPTAKQRLA